MRWLRWALGAYVLLATATRLAEVVGLHRCACAAACWCKHPALSTFRWVFPYGHLSVDALDDEALATTG